MGNHPCNKPTKPIRVTKRYYGAVLGVGAVCQNDDLEKLREKARKLTEEKFDRIYIYNNYADNGAEFVELIKWTVLSEEKTNAAKD